MPTVLQYRGTCLESEHPASAVAVRGGRVVWQAGDDRETTYRSSSKPFQLACSLEALGDPAVSAEELAVGAASHNAEPAHLAVVSAILDRFGATVGGLRCGAHPPGHTPSAEAILRAGGAFTDLHNNCSGKHAFMLAAALRNGWDADYRPMAHPLQQRIAARLAQWMEHTPAHAIDGCGVPTFIQPLSAVARSWEAVALAQWMEHTPAHAIDGCGVPTFIQPLSAVARSWEAVALAMRSVELGSADDAWTARLGRIGLAMAAHPELTSGTGRLDLAVVRAARETMAVKVGAGGLFCVALPGRETSVVVKVHSGAMEALPALVAWALAEAAPGAWREPDGWELRCVRNVVGREVGTWRVSD